MRLLSVIIPCYNSELYVKNALESVLANKLDDIEIILVNDGSTDNTIKILNEYQNKYPNIKVVNKENGGLSSARNAGIKEATGQYLAFLDSDDTVDERMYKLMLDKALEENYDIVVCNEKRVYPTYSIDVDSGVDKDLTNKEDIKNIIYKLYPAACNKIYKKSLLSNIKFKEGVLYEDIEFTYRLISSINSIGTVKESLYNYYQRENSITYTYNSRLYEMLDNLESIYNYYKDNNLLNTYNEEIEYVYLRYAYCTFLRRLSHMKNKKEYDKGVKYVLTKINKRFPNYKKNKYLKKSLKGKYIKYFNKLLANIMYYIDRNKVN